jgi:hypothetical protein
MKERIKEIFTKLVKSINVNGYYRDVEKIQISNAGKTDTIYIFFSDFKNGDESALEIDLSDKIHNKWYFRLYNKIIEEYTNSDEDYLSMTDNYSVINFYTDWISKLEYASYGLYLRVNLAELTGFIRDKKISKLLE